jgi:hypothetical protein
VVICFIYWLVVGWALPLWKIWVSCGMMKFPTYGKIKSQTTNQLILPVFQADFTLFDLFQSCSKSEKIFKKTHLQCPEIIPRLNHYHVIATIYSELSRSGSTWWHYLCWTKKKRCLLDKSSSPICSMPSSPTFTYIRSFWEVNVM